MGAMSRTSCECVGVARGKRTNGVICNSLLVDSPRTLPQLVLLNLIYSNDHLFANRQIYLSTGLETPRFLMDRKVLLGEEFCIYVHNYVIIFGALLSKL